MVKHDLARLERVIETLFEKSIAGDVNASVAFIRALERRAALVGLDSVRTIDLTITPSAVEPSGYAKITAALLSLKYDRANGGDGALGESVLEPRCSAARRWRGRSRDARSSWRCRWSGS
jgi:hypothetical protein